MLVTRFGKSSIIARNADGSDGAEDATGNNGRLIHRRTTVTKTVFCILHLLPGSHHHFYFKKKAALQKAKRL